MILSYIWKIRSGFDGKRLFKTVNKVHERSGKNRVVLFFDILYCGFKFGAGYNDYALYEFERLKNSQRKDYLTRAKNDKLVSILNKRSAAHRLDDKAEFNSIFAKYIKRNWIDLDKADSEEFKSFLKSVKCIAVKPKDCCCGQGFEKIYTSDTDDSDKLYERLKNEGKTLVEEYVIQHSDISKLYPHSVNTLRILTINLNGKCDIIYALIRIGNKGACVDNINAGGMCAPIDIETGRIAFPGYDKDGNVYEAHPETGTKIVGYQIPLWEKAKEMCVEAAALVPETGYVGWDVCVTQDDVLLIEGNDFPGHDLLQLPAHNPENKGMLPLFRKYVPEL